jgi:DNA repair protein RadC
MIRVLEYKVIKKTKVKLSDMPIITTSEDAYKYFKQIFTDEIYYQETVYVLALNTAKRVLGHFKLSSGGVSHTIIDSRILFPMLLLTPGCTDFIMAHNHPSGNLKPSFDDKKATDTLTQAGQLLGITLLDHLIVSSEGYAIVKE